MRYQTLEVRHPNLVAVILRSGISVSRRLYIKVLDHLREILLLELQISFREHRGMGMPLLDSRPLQFLQNYSSVPPENEGFCFHFVLSRFVVLEYFWSRTFVPRYFELVRIVMV